VRITEKGNPLGDGLSRQIGENSKTGGPAGAVYQRKTARVQAWVPIVGSRGTSLDRDFRDHANHNLIHVKDPIDNNLAVPPLAGFFRHEQAH